MLACGSSTDQVQQDQCLAYGSTCDWAYNTCFTTAVALVKGAFRADDASASVAVATTCASAQSAVACGAAGSALSVNSSLIAKVAAGNFSIVTPAAGNDTDNATMSDNGIGAGSNTTIILRRGASDAPRTGTVAVFAAALVWLLLQS
jgi:hypothetical protein